MATVQHKRSEESNISKTKRYQRHQMKMTNSSFGGSHVQAHIAFQLAHNTLISALCGEKNAEKDSNLTHRVFTG